MSATSVLARVQRGLESLYRVETRLDVDCFVVDEAGRDHALKAAPAGARLPREQLLLSEENQELGLALFVDGAAIANLERHDPASGLGDHNFGDFCLAVEGVSHFIYVALCAEQERAVTALELELQAEVDKFVSCYLVEGDPARETGELRRRLFDSVSFAADLDGDERERYHTANDQARRYAQTLDRRYIARGRVPDMLAELRRFYRLSLQDKLGHIAQAA